jgi:hypothetical protein
MKTNAIRTIAATEFKAPCPDLMDRVGAGSPADAG